MKREKLSKAAASGAVALIFLVLGFQAAIFTGNVFRYNREHRIDTVYVTTNDPPRETGPDRGDGQIIAEGMKDLATGAREGAGRLTVREPGLHARPLPGAYGDTHSGQKGKGLGKGIAPLQEPGYSDSRRVIAEKLEKKPEAETFEFDPNTISHQDLIRLGFSDKQAQVIENYRSKGGKYTSPRDFARMYVVDSSMYARLEPFIKITKLDLNTADSLQLISLRGIGPYYAHKIIEYRRRLGGIFTSKEQLLEIDGLDADRLGGFAQSVTLGGGEPRFTLWTATREQLSAHPYIGAYAARGIIRYKSVTDTAAWSLDDLVKGSVVSEDNALRLGYLAGGGQSHDK